jgi:hypothetical protein
MGTMPLRAKVDDERDGPARSSLAEALRRLDPYSFFTVPAEPGSGGDVVVVGTTGTFLVKACGMKGVATIKGRRPLVGDEAIDGLRSLRAGAKRLSSRLSAKSALANVEAVVCLTEAIAPPAAGAAGVRFVRAADLAHDLSARPRLQSHTRAQSAARVLGVQVAGDQRRHFAIR